MAATLNLFDAAMQRMRAIRQGDLVQIVIDGGGALVTTTMEFQQAQKWAQRKQATGNIVSDRGRVLEQINVLVSRPGSMVTTRGNAKHVEGLAKLMKQAGYELNDWMLPPELKQLGMPQQEPAKKKTEDDAGDTPPS